MAGANFYFNWYNNCPDHGYYVPDKADKMRSSMLIISTAIILVGLTYLFSLIIPLQWDNTYLIVAGLLIILTIIVHQINSIALRKRGRDAIIPYIATTILKLILASIMLIILIKTNQDLAKELVIIFLVYYAVFSALEIVMVNRTLRVQKL